MTVRSTLFTPAFDPSMMWTALRSDADAVTFDLEDAVASAEKPTVREAFVPVARPVSVTDLIIGVRINPLDRDGGVDPDALAGTSGPSYVVLPNVERGADIEALSTLDRARAAGVAGSDRSES
ncbi:aldolase/citrate lyase family protein [Halomarina halobia]|uniref:Aldolase/citrate lyase family protein n=1 Tax=Halomarina halobia TaxID=3033386 RepID=A0ABD6AES7_9EURY|nr:aldolase/citrate lyase family protein [Halomarina sp. PSR21]